ncbi:MAG: carboxypeptidase PM20D1, partial [Bacteroidia bacterium]
TADSVVVRVRELIDDPDVEILYDGWGELPPAASYTDSGFTVISEAITQVYPDAVITPSLLTATTDTRHYISVVDNLYRFHGLLVGTGQASTVHGTGEYISIESYQNMIEVERHMLRLGAQ